MTLAPAADPQCAAAVPDPGDGQRAGAPTSSGTVVRGNVSSRDMTERILENSHHIATLDHDAPAIFEESTEFVRRVTGP